MNSIKDTSVIILAAGLGTRLRPYTESTPKCMVKLDGIPIIERQIEILRNVGFENIIIVGGYKHEMLEYQDAEILVNERYGETNMIWSLYTAEEKIKGDVLITYGDVLYTCKMVEQLASSNYDFAVACDMNWESYWKSRMDDPIKDLESFKKSSENIVKELGQKAKTMNEIQGQYMGLTYIGKQFSKEFRSRLNKFCTSRDVINGRNSEESYMTDFLNDLVVKGIKLKAHPVNDQWIEVDTVADLESPMTLKRLRHINSANRNYNRNK